MGVWLFGFGFLALVLLLALDLTLGASALYLPQRRAFINVPRHMQNKTLTLANAQRDSPAQASPVMEGERLRERGELGVGAAYKRRQAEIR